jgi:hypothetical protein
MKFHFYPTVVSPHTHDEKQHLLMQTKQQANLPTEAEEAIFSGTAPGNMAVALSRRTKQKKNKKRVGEKTCSLF